MKTLHSLNARQGPLRLEIVEDQAAARQQGQLRRKAKAVNVKERQHVEHDIVRRESPAFLQREQAGRDIAMRVNDAFGPAGGAGAVHQQAGIVGVNFRRPKAGRRRPEYRVLDQNMAKGRQAGSHRFEMVRGFRVGDRNGRRAIAHEKPQLFAREARIQRQRHSAGIDRCKTREQERLFVLQAQDDTIPFGGSQFLKKTGDAAHALI